MVFNKLTMEQSEKRQYVADIRAGDRIEDLFVLSAKTLGHKKDGNPYLTLTLADKSGQAAAVVWDQVEQISAAANAGDFVRVSALAGEYRGRPAACGQSHVGGTAGCGIAG